MTNLSKVLHYYLPHGLKLKFPKNYRFGDGIKSDQEVFVLKGILDGSIAVFGRGCFHPPHVAKPLMHSLDSLTKEITVEGYNDGNPFKPIQVLYDRDDYVMDWHDYLDNGETPPMHHAPFWIIQLLLQWHFNLWLNEDQYIKIES